ncbi:MAG: addiction module protein [Pirellulaceae bacterium]|nr:addiction module protein [Pirellulaceae bacterium]
MPTRGGRAISTEALLEQVRQLSVAERIRFVADVWDTIDLEQPDLPLSSQLREELDRHLEDYHAHPDAGSSWDEVKARLRTKP